MTFDIFEAPYERNNAMYQQKILKNLKAKALNFIDIGVGCNALVSFKTLGLLDFLLKGNSIDYRMLKNSSFCSNFPLARAALITLVKIKVLEEKFGKYQLTNLGYELCNYIGLITMFFDGYGPLIINQSKIAINKISFSHKYLRGDVIAASSIQFGKNTLDPLIKDIFSSFSIRGTFCDLGCGMGTKLAWISKLTGNPGLGFENCKKTVKIISKKFKKNKKLSFEHQDVTNLIGIWEDVTVLMQYFVFHDFTPTQKCAALINSYLKNFPYLRYFIYVDIVAPSSSQDEIMPGFEYVHGLQGIETRTYEETMELFQMSKFEMINENKIPDMPNTFLWILKPNNSR